MAIDRKYGKVTVELTPGNPLGEDEPVVVFRARDQELVSVLEDYYKNCSNSGCTLEHLAGIRETQENVLRWQEAHLELVKMPD